jgi:hypothetical protein
MTLKEQLIQAMKKIPHGVINGHYQKAVDYKRWHANTSKVINSGRDNEQTLRSLLNQYENFK